MTARNSIRRDEIYDNGAGFKHPPQSVPPLSWTAQPQRQRQGARQGVGSDGTSLIMKVFYQGVVLEL